MSDERREYSNSWSKLRVSPLPYVLCVSPDHAIDTDELLEKRILDAVSSLIDSKLAPLFESVVQASSTLSATLKSNETAATARARAQNARIEEVEASAKRRMEEVERQIGAERIKSRREVTQRMQKLEQRLESVEKEAESKEVAAIETRFKLAELERKMDSLTKQAQTLSVVHLIFS